MSTTTGKQKRAAVITIPEKHRLCKPSNAPRFKLNTNAKAFPIYEFRSIASLNETIQSGETIVTAGSVDKEGKKTYQPLASFNSQPYGNVDIALQNIQLTEVKIGRVNYLAYSLSHDPKDMESVKAFQDYILAFEPAMQSLLKTEYPDQTVHFELPVKAILMYIPRGQESLEYSKNADGEVKVEKKVTPFDVARLMSGMGKLKIRLWSFNVRPSSSEPNVLSVYPNFQLCSSKYMSDEELRSLEDVRVQVVSEPKPKRVKIVEPEPEEEGEEEE